MKVNNNKKHLKEKWTGLVDKNNSNIIIFVLSWLHMIMEAPMMPLLPCTTFFASTICAEK